MLESPSPIMTLSYLGIPTLWVVVLVTFAYGIWKYRTALKKVESERLQTQENLRKLTEKLTRTNHELEQFSYIVSHDLKEPLRTVVTYLQLFVRKQGAELTEDKQSLLGVVVDATKRMNDLLDGLLEYSRAENAPCQIQDINLNLVVENTLHNLAETVNKYQAEITFDDLPAVRGDSAQMHQLFQYLIGNALKFRGPANPRIHIRSDFLSDGSVCLAVEDNGIGFDPKQAENIFKIFRQLNGRNRFAGNGIGLAVCQRIVEKHNGRIWAESEVGRGAVFKIKFPSRELSTQLH